jgi:hypothetical protein
MRKLSLLVALVCLGSCYGMPAQGAFSVPEPLNGMLCTASDGTLSWLTVTVLGDGSLDFKCPSSGPKLVFLTSATYTGNLGGLQGADSICQTVAARSGTPGVFKAWLSSNQGSPANRFTHSSSPYKLHSGATIAANWTALISGNIGTPINEDEAGNPVSEGFVWTNTTAEGAPWYIPDSVNGSCAGWTDGADDGSLGAHGINADTRRLWSAQALSYCRLGAHLYCFQQ